MNKDSRLLFHVAQIRAQDILNILHRNSSRPQHTDIAIAMKTINNRTFQAHPARTAI
ncbi:hypothetical protein EW026_g4795 [Hermanssonia centrifuga]|uniref:Uncharacterized protein n=1 Tax=Hermanssonia centrifuga TaxID=98765 RepID=A0A4V3XAD1_9APHY|nr:hypothetical protein EW026_g4795 [Hermanssonia centrifuga]